MDLFYSNARKRAGQALLCEDKTEQKIKSRKLIPGGRFMQKSSMETKFLILQLHFRVLTIFSECWDQRVGNTMHINQFFNLRSEKGF